MLDMRVRQLAQSLINQAVRLAPGEKLLLELMGLETPQAKEIIRAAYAAGG